MTRIYQAYVTASTDVLAPEPVFYSAALKSRFGGAVKSPRGARRSGTTVAQAMAEPRAIEPARYVTLRHVRRETIR